MIVVSVVLHSAVTGQTTEIARSVIHNTGGDHPIYGDYETFACRGRDKDALHQNMLDILGGTAKPIHRGQVCRHKRLKLHVWTLVLKSLLAMGYGDRS